MSTPNPGGRRRRIAGERRPVRPPDAPESPPPSQVDLTEPLPPQHETPPPPADGTPSPPPPEPRRARRSLRGARPARTEGRRTPGWWGSPASLLALGLLLLALLVPTVLGALGLLGNDSLGEARDDLAQAEAWEAGDSAPAAAERAAAAILAYDHRSLDASRETAERFLTADFADQYVETFEKVVAPAARQTRARVTADVNASAVVRATEGRVRVLLFVDQTTQSTASPRPKLALNRVEMVMVRDSGSWLVDDITSY